MSMFKIIIMIYGLLMLAGGYMGYAKAGSKMSLVMGIVSGILILLGVYLLGNNPVVGQVLVTAVSALLTVVFLSRLLKTQAFMPSGMLLTLSAGVLVLCVMKLISKG